MNLPTLINRIYGQVSMSGLFSFEFVDDKRKTITEIFFMQPPSSKSLEEVARSSTMPTLQSNYNVDAGNGTKSLNLSGTLWFGTVGSPDNPIAMFPNGLPNLIDGLNEFFKLRWMLIRYKDYTMTKKSKTYAETSALNLSKELITLYEQVESNIKNRIGALSDKVELVFHDYDMDDHYYTRISGFTASMDAKDHLSVSYTISGECYERFYGKSSASTKIKKTDNEEIETLSKNIEKLNFTDALSNIQKTQGYNSKLFSASQELSAIVENIIDENVSIQQADSYILDNMPTLASKAVTASNNLISTFTNLYVTEDVRDDFIAGDTTLDSILTIDLLEFYNTIQKLRFTITGMIGIMNAIPKTDTIKYYTTADNYTLSEEQFDSDNEKKIQGSSAFIFHVIKQGETFIAIAKRYYGDEEKYISILNANDISQNDLIDNNYVGKIIKIPLDLSTNSRSETNLIYDGNYSPDTIMEFLHGRDIKLINGAMLTSTTNDIQTIEGVDNTLQSLDNRMTTTKGSLNVPNSDYGLIRIDEGNTPFLVKISKFLDDMFYQFQSDPRVQSVNMGIDTLEVSGDKAQIKNTVNLIGDETREVQIG